MGSEKPRLDPTTLLAGFEIIAAWRRHPEKPIACPVCGAEGLRIIDRSARPHAEWYTLSCSACGLEESIQLPMGSPRQEID